ncbi:orotidine-5'-phosphate decarboxylase [Candidatus Woesearchaeota archaeon]|nr:orotidine-5'-phosphate decarboxylase [Candidatus Woesearchaeota archaeon]
METSKEIARILLEKEAVTLNTTHPYTYASGIRGPIYCDNRKLIAHPTAREFICKAFLEKIKNSDFDVIAGTATAGIPWASFLAQHLQKPLAYVRSEKKAHGKGNQIEGAEVQGKKVIIIEDLISTGGSSITTLEACRNAGAIVCGIYAIFSYDFPDTQKEFQKNQCTLITLTTFSVLLQVAKENKNITPEQEKILLAWNKDPVSWGAQYSPLKNESPLTEKEQKAKNLVCLALDDLHSLDDVKKQIQSLSPYVGMFKIGKELFTRFGTEVVKLCKEQNKNLFLDLKFHDIPNTVRLAVKAATELGVDLITLHSSGGKEMMKAAVQGRKEANLAKKPKLIAVTVLTSIDEQTLHQELKIPEEINSYILHLMFLAKESGMDGVVCSAADLVFLKDNLPHDLFFVTPGIQGPYTTVGSDQKRILTPGKAIQAGASLLVIGRAITASPNPEQAAKEILQDIAKVI